ncbi:hypothetical protein MKW92_005924 [Papaver armeniacum]|nr:hypothetical protein MKW92_005924 [Papaver armeniacum]
MTYVCIIRDTAEESHGCKKNPRMERKNFTIKYELPAPAWSCSWDLDSEHHMYTGLQNGMLLLFDMRQTSGPVESMNGLTSHPIHTIHSLPENSPLHNGGRSVLQLQLHNGCYSTFIITFSSWPQTRRN